MNSIHFYTLIENRLISTTKMLLKENQQFYFKALAQIDQSLLIIGCKNTN